MTDQAQLVSRRSTTLFGMLGPLSQIFTQSHYARRVSQPGICDFALGNPHEMALPGFVQALQQTT